MKLNIPSVIYHNNQPYKFYNKAPQKSVALRIGRKLEKQSQRFRIKFIGSTYYIYKEVGKNEKTRL